MRHTIAVFTYARDIRFNATGILELDSKPALQKFLIDGIDERFIGVGNNWKSEYERTKMRDALIELIDVLQTKEHGRPYTFPEQTVQVRIKSTLQKILSFVGLPTHRTVDVEHKKNHKPQYRVIVNLEINDHDLLDQKTDDQGLVGQDLHDETSPPSVICLLFCAKFLIH